MTRREPQVYNSVYLVSLLPTDHVEFRRFAMRVEFSPVRGKYTVSPNIDGRMLLVSSEGEPVYRTESNQHLFDGEGSDTIFFTLEKALEVAKEYVHYIVANGITADSLLEWEEKPEDHKAVHQNWKDFFNGVADETSTWTTRF